MANIVVNIIRVEEQKLFGVWKRENMHVLPLNLNLDSCGGRQLARQSSIFIRSGCQRVSTWD